MTAAIPSELINTPLHLYLKPEDLAQIGVAYRFAEDAHRGVMRKSGEPYITHPLAVASILAELRVDTPTILAALLHDVVEDTGATKQTLSDHFGQQVADLVDGVTKLDKIEFRSASEAQAENFRKMILAMSQDVRVILVKLADRLHNMQTLESMAPHKQRRIAKETMEIYAPIANRLGLNEIFQSLVELSFRYLYPLRFRAISKAVKASRGDRKEIIPKILATIESALKEHGIAATVSGREKHLFSIYKKMIDRRSRFSQIYDIYGFRVIVNDRDQCYLALGVLHSLYKPILSNFRDYIAIPKANGYQSLHTTLFGPFGAPIEVQIRSQDMHHVAEVGVAAHWLYKNHDWGALNRLQQDTYAWLQGVLELQNKSANSTDFLEHFKADLFQDEVYVFTPKGRILALPKGSTAVDFAYSVHTDVGNHCTGVLINQEFMPLRTELASGDHVEIITDEQAHPSVSWLGYVVTARARASIRHFLVSQHLAESAQLGEQLLGQAMQTLNTSLDVIQVAHWERIIRTYAMKTRDDILSEIGMGKRQALLVAHQLLVVAGLESDPPAIAHKPVNKVTETITISGAEGIAVQFSECCYPIPGDPILGFMQKGRGLIIHVHNCRDVQKFKRAPQYWLDVEWAPAQGQLFKVKLAFTALNQPGVLAKITTRLAQSGTNISKVSVEADGNNAMIYFIIQVKNRVQLAGLIRGLRKIPEVMRISRN